MPPPAPDVYTVAEVAQALRTGKTAQTVEGRALEVRAGSTARRTASRRWAAAA